SGIMSALVNGIKQAFDIDINIKDYSEHTLGLSTESRAVTYVEIQSNLQLSYFGVSINSDSLKALLQATLNAVSSFLDQDESFNRLD
ncbi:alpha-isopropylmalate synthase regulatory domain-containing protein, partial [Vibrio cyclitrophicus]